MARGFVYLVLVGLLVVGVLAEGSLDNILQDAWTKHTKLVEQGVYDSAQNAAKRSRTVNHKCAHDKLMKEPTRQAHYNEMRRNRDRDILEKSPKYQKIMREKRQATFESIRFFSDTRILASTSDPYTCYSAGENVNSYQSSGSRACTDNDVNGASVQSYLTQTVIPTIVSTFQALLTVVRRPATWQLTPSQLCPSIAASYANVTVRDADFYVFFAARAVDDASTIATAEACAVEANGRPIVALVNFNPASFRSMPSDFFEFKKDIRVGMHELTHALGFSTGSFSSYLDPDGNLWPASRFETNGGIYTGIRTPKVLDWARAYFDCPGLTAMPLENDGGTGTASSHWEQQAVFDEYMVGFATQFFPISNLTLSLLADSGWYQPDYSKAEDLSWGWHKGCTFIEGSCTSPSWNAVGDLEPYGCSGTSQGCTADRLAVGICAASNPSVTMPGCAFFAPSNDIKTYCQNNGTESDPTISDFSCDQCRCFSISNPATSKRQACYQVDCVRTGGTPRLRVQYGKKWYNCPEDGSEGSFKASSTVPGISTTVHCPAAVDLCHQTSLQSDKLVGYTGKTGWKWIFTNNSLLFWGIVAIIIVLGMCAICLVMCLCSRLCNCLCCGNKGRNRAFMMRR